MSDTYDVAIVGAGPGGSAAAYELARRGLDVALLDKARFPRDKTCGDGLTPRALVILDEMGLLDELLQVGCRINGIDFFGPNGRSVTVSLAPANDLPGYMLIVPRLILDDLIRQRALAAGAQFHGQVRVTNIAPQADGVLLTGERQGQEVSFRARAAIVATGASFKLLEHMGLLRRPPQMMVAARAYFEDMAGVTDRVHCHFDGAPMPGYGWVFPTSNSSANVGAGFLPDSLMARLKRLRSRPVFDTFIRAPSLQAMLGPARRVGPVKGYPIRIDFDRSPTFGERVLLVGEAAGLVNPLTGEGIDYALESAQLAAGHLAAMLAEGDFTRPRFEAYDQTLRKRFQRLFVLSNRLRSLYLNPLLLNRLVKAADRRPEIRQMLMRVAVENQGLADGMSFGTLLKVVLA